MSRWTGPHAVRDARPEGDGGWGDAVRCRPVAHAVAVARHFLFFGCFSFETFKNQTKSESAAKAAQSLVTDTPHATRPGPTPITVKNKYQKRKSFYSLNNSASRSRELLRPCEVRREVGESYASVCCSMLGAHTAYYIASLCEAAHHEPSTTSLMFAYMPATPPRAPAHATK